MGRISLFFKNREFNLANCRMFLEELRKTNSANSMRSWVKDLHAFIRFAYDYDYIPLDFANKIPMPKAEDRLFNLITESQAVEAIEEGSKPCPFDNRYAKKSKNECRMGLLFILFTGLRNSELRKLQVEDFNMQEKIFRVKSKGGKVELANIPLNLVEPLRAWIKQRGSGRMFAVSEDSLRYTLHRGCKALGLPIQRVHDLRHIASLTRLRRREPLQLVSRFLRHKKIAMTDRIYSQYLITDIAPTTNNTPEIQKSITPESVLDTLEDVIKAFGIQHDKRFKFVRTNGRVSIEAV